MDFTHTPAAPFAIDVGDTPPDLSKPEGGLMTLPPDDICSSWTTSDQDPCLLPASRPPGLSREELTRINHEVRTPMNGILGFAGLLLETPLNSDQQAFAQTIEECGHALLTFWDTLLDLWTLDASDLQLRELEFDPTPVLQEAAASIRTMAARKGLEVRFNPSGMGTITLTSDPARFRQTLHYLLDNALKFTKQGHIELSWSEMRPGWCRIMVSDTGIGVPHSHLKRIFLPFAQVDSSPTRSEGGSGLGLAMARRLVELQNGRIGCESQLGMGSRFWFELPAKSS